MLMVRQIFDVRDDERPVALSALATISCLGAAVAVIASAADALFLAHVGPGRLGFALALSSVLLMVVLGWLGARVDRVAGRGRGIVLSRLLWFSACLLLGLGVVAQFSPALGGWLLLLLGKQLASASDLVFWVLAAERLDARQNRRLLPAFVAAHGLGTVLGAFAVGPLAHAFGSRGTIAFGASLFALAALVGRRFTRESGARIVPSAAVETSKGQSMLQVVASSRLARHLAVLIAVAGVFAPLLYVAMASLASESFADEAALTAFFGQYRGAVQILTLVAQVVLAPRMLARAGVALNLVLAPLGALACSVMLGLHRSLVLVVLAQAVVKLLDAALQTPAEKLTQNLLPQHVRGRVAGFLDGVAKRAGAILGGVSASLLIAWPEVMMSVLAGVAALWLAVATRVFQRFAELAVAELERHTVRDTADLEPLVDERSVAHLRAGLVDPGQQEMALAIVERLGERGRVDIAVELARAAGQVEAPLRLLESLVACLERSSNGADCAGIASDIRSILARQLRAADSELGVDGLLCVRIIGLCGIHGRQQLDGQRQDIARELQAAMTPAVTPGLALAVGVAETRVSGRDPYELIREHLVESAASEVAFDELRIELGVQLDGQASRPELLLERSWDLLRGLRRRARERADRSCAEAGLTMERIMRRYEREAAISAEVILLRNELHRLARQWLEPDSGPWLVLAGASLLSLLARPEDSHLLAGALAIPEPRTRRAAMAGLSRLGADALEALLSTSRYARRGARVAAGAVLLELRLSREELQHAIESELEVIDRSILHLSLFARLEEAELLSMRLAERIHEASHALFVMLQARVEKPGIAVIASKYLDGGPGWCLGRGVDGDEGRVSKARALEALDTLLPRDLALRVTAVLEDAPLEVRGSHAAERLGVPQRLAHAVRAELAQADALTRALVVRILDGTALANLRGEILAAAADVARDADPMAIMRRLSKGRPTNGFRAPGESDVPRLVETIAYLHEISLFGELTTRQLAELAGLVRWRSLRAGEVVFQDGQTDDTMYFVVSGRVVVETAPAHESDPSSGQRVVVEPGDAFGQMALFERSTRAATATAQEKSRIGCIVRREFERLVDDMPAIALAICRVLGRRASATGW